jgi:SHS2 domain-containing protein
MPEAGMHFEYLDDLTAADVAFRAEGESLEAVFEAAWEATLGVMIVLPEDSESSSPPASSGGCGETRAPRSQAPRPRVRRRIRLSAPEPELLLHDLLEELVYRKDAEGLLLRLSSCRVWQDGGLWRLEAVAAGEKIDPTHHRLGIDVKAVTWHRFNLVREQGLWRATVILDV